MQKPTIKKPKSDSPSYAGKTVLLIDPDLNSHATHKFYLSKYAIRFLGSKNLNQAFLMAQKCPPDLIISEIYFDEEVSFKDLFLFGQKKNIPIIIQSSVTLDKHQESCSIYGAHAYFLKPLFWMPYLIVILDCLKGKENLN